MELMKLEEIDEGKYIKMHEFEDERAVVLPLNTKKQA